MTEEIKNAAEKSWRTTILGIIGGLLLIVPQVVNLIDGNAETVFVWEQVAMGLTAMGIGMFARDNNVSSEEAGVK